ncbi:MAG: DUF2780 domain-containing protein [Deltaproteobacteria bacterium]|nr:DUF2780 domain-containing protein [Deltaproteobacteria bacterium]
MKKNIARTLGILTAVIFCASIIAMGTGAYAMGNKQAAPVKTAPVTKAAPSPTRAVAGELVNLLSSQLGVTTPQATGGAGAIFSLAKSKMSAPDFGQIASVLPDMGTLLKAAPAITSAGSKATSLMKGMNTLTSLYQSFSKLGLSANMVSKFMPIILSFLQSKGGDAVSNLLSSALNLPAVQTTKAITDTLFNTK